MSTPTPSTDAFLSHLIGTWSLLSITATSTTSSTVLNPLGVSLLGSLIYTPDGYMISLVQSLSLVPSSSSNWTNPSAEEAVNSIRGTQSYTGPFYVEKTYPEFDGVAKDDLGDGESVFRRTLYHDIKTAQPATWRGTLQKRLCTMTKGEDGKWRLEMRVEESVDMGALGDGQGATWKMLVSFVRAEENEPGMGLHGRKVDELK